MFTAQRLIEDRRYPVEKTIENLQAQLDALSKEYQDFAYAASHDLRASLRHLEWYLEQVVEANQANFDEESKSAVASAFEVLQKQRSLISDLTDYSRVNTSHLSTSKIDLEELCSKVAQRFQYDLDENQCEVALRSLPIFQGREKHIEILFNHLFKNAIMFRSPERLLAITIEGQQNEGLVQIDFIDNGIGIKEKHQKKVFAMFSRAAGSEYPGNGAGLAIAKRIVNAHGGNIWLSSPNDMGGTTVHMTFSVE